MIATALAWAVSSAWAGANLFSPKVTIAVEDVPGTEAQPDRDQNDVAVAAQRTCRMNGAGLLVGETIDVVGVAGGATLTNSVRLALPAVPATATVRRGADAPEAAAYDAAGRLRLWDDFDTAFVGAPAGFVNTVGSPFADGVPTRIEATYSPGVDTGGRCPSVALVVVRDAEGVAIDANSTLPANNQPLMGIFPGDWPVPVETRPIEIAYPEFAAWLADRVGGCANGCANEDWSFHPSLPDVIVRPDLGTSAPLPSQETCSDGAWNQDEEGVDCGGDVCAPCPGAWQDHCKDRVQNADETGVDCGGSRCLECVTDCDGDPIANPALEILRFEGVVHTIDGTGAVVGGPAIGDALTGWVAWDTGPVDDLWPEIPDVGLYCYDAVPGQFQMVIRSPDACWESLEYDQPVEDAFDCQYVADDSAPYWDPVPHDYVEWFSWDLGPYTDVDWTLGSLQLVTHDHTDAISGTSPREWLPPLSTFEDRLLYLELTDGTGDYRGYSASLDALRGNIVEPGYGTVFYTAFAQDLVPFGSIESDGTLTPIGTGLPVPGESNPTLVLVPAPDGTLYAFNTGRLRAGSPGSQAPYSSWGRVDATTGSFTRIGDLGQVFKIPSSFGGIKEPQFVFDGPGRLLAFGLDKDYQARFVELDLANGAYNDLVTGLGSQVSSVAEGPDGTLYYAQSAGGTAPVPFGTVQPDGTMTPIGTGLVLGPSEASNSSTRLLFAPDGTLYGFNTGGLRTGSPGGSANPSSWGRIDPATGTFTLLGNLSDLFKIPSSFAGIKEPVFWFDARGRLFATGLTPSYQTRLVRFDTETGAATVLLTVGDSQTKVAVTPGAPTGEEAACWSAGATWRYPGCDCPSGTTWYYSPPVHASCNLD